MTSDLQTCGHTDATFTDQSGSQICTLYDLTPGNGICWEDYGAPLFINYSNQNTIAGIASWVDVPGDSSCLSSGVADHFTNAYYHLDFIIKVTGLIKPYLTAGGK
ncbi:hypothetical protein GGI26_004951 [Coemansia sp. RSA 1358]|nr:hypothetical protein EDC05_005723 [Coemansia umbellata]KAJ2620463.1 hypothetical protein GGI26_004951 [Coemansia sp. RSA 1358]